MSVYLIQLLLQLKNAADAKKKYIDIRINKKSFLIIKILYKAGFLQSFNLLNNKMRIFFRYNYNKSLLKNLKIISKPSIRHYIDYSLLCRINSKFNVGFLTTDKGLLTSIECKKKKIGGILLFIC